MSEKIYDVVVIGGGPAGLTSALYTSRARLSTVVLEKSKLGGQITITHEIANYPGAVLGSEEEPSGAELIARMVDQVKKFGAEIEVGKEVAGMKLESEIKEITCGDGSVYKAKSVIIATGAVPREIGCPGEKKLTGRGVSYCATCDGPFFEDMEMYVVGGGNAAIEEALYLAKLASKVTIIHRRDELRAEAMYVEKAFANKKIDYIWDSVVEEIEGDGMVESMTVKNVKTGELTKIEANEEDGTFGIFVFVGFLPQTEVFKGHVAMDDDNYVLTDEDMQTSVEGVFAAGDLRPKLLRQVVTATGDGATAAFAAQKYLESKE